MATISRVIIQWSSGPGSNPLQSMSPHGCNQNPTSHSFTATQEPDRLQARTLQRTIADLAVHWLLDFSGLLSIATDAREPMTAALPPLNARQVELEPHGLERLRSVARPRSNPAEAADIDLRLQVLRLSQDEQRVVKLAAATCGVAPAVPLMPCWRAAAAVGRFGAVCPIRPDPSVR